MLEDHLFVNPFPLHWLEVWNLFSLFSDTAVGINTDSETIATGHLCVISSYQNCENEGNEIPSYHTCLTIYGSFFLSFLGGDFSSSFWAYYFSNCELKVTLKILSSLKMFSFNLGPLCDFQNNPSHYSLQRFALNSSYYVINLIILFHLEIEPPTAQDGSDS